MKKKRIESAKRLVNRGPKSKYNFCRHLFYLFIFIKKNIFTIFVIFILIIIEEEEIL